MSLFVQLVPKAWCSRNSMLATHKTDICVAQGVLDMYHFGFMFLRNTHFWIYFLKKKTFLEISHGPPL